MRRGLSLVVASFVLVAPARPAEVPEYQVKAAFLYNFAQYTQWPESVARTLTVCTYGSDRFGNDLDTIRDRVIGNRTLKLLRHVDLQAAPGCQVLYVAPDAVGALPRVIGSVAGHPVLIVADAPGAARAGAMINMSVSQNRVTFEANRRAARAAGLDLSSQLLRLATEVIQ